MFSAIDMYTLGTSVPSQVTYAVACNICNHTGVQEQTANIAQGAQQLM
jgi:hypothetical protein